MLAAAALLLASLIAAPERPASVERIGVAASRRATTVVSATNGPTMLVVYDDRRGGQAVRFDGAGRRLEPTSIGLPISAAGVFWNGEHWVLLNRAQFVRMDADGELLDRTPRPLPATLTGSIVNAVCAGEAVLVATTNFDTSELVLWTFDRDLTALLSRTVVDSLSVATQSYALASDGNGALLVHQNVRTYEYWAWLYDASGRLQQSRVVSRPGVPVAGVAIGTDGDGGYLVLHNTSYRPNRLVAGFRVDASLRVRAVQTFQLIETPEYFVRPAPHIGFDGSDYHAYFGVPRDGKVDVIEVRSNSEGTTEAIEPLFTYDAFYAWSIHAQIAGATPAVVYGDMIDSQLEIMRIRAGGMVFEASTGPFEQTAPAVASSAAQSLVAWREEISPTLPPAIFATRVDPRGNGLDPQSIALGGLACVNSNTAPAAAGDGRDFLVVWQEATAIAGSLVRPDGTAKPVRVSFKGLDASCVSEPVKVASNGSIYLVVWSVPAPHTDDHDLRAVRVAGDGTVLDQVPIALAEAQPIEVVSDGRDFLVTTGREAVRISADGKVLDPAGIRLDGRPRKTWWNGQTYVVAVEDEREPGIRFRRIGSDGSGGAAFGETPPELHPRTAVPFGSDAFRCDARGCAFPLLSDGALYLVRVEDPGDRFTVSRELVDAAPVPLGDGAPESLSYTAGFLTYTRRVLDDGNSSRLFVWPLFEGGRGRAVRK